MKLFRFAKRKNVEERGETWKVYKMEPGEIAWTDSNNIYVDMEGNFMIDANAIIFNRPDQWGYADIGIRKSTDGAITVNVTKRCLWRLIPMPISTVLLPVDEFVPVDRE